MKARKETKEDRIRETKAYLREIRKIFPADDSLVKAYEANLAELEALDECFFRYAAPSI